MTAPVSPAVPGITYDYVISTDGGCWPNDGTGTGGWAAVIRSKDGHYREISGAICPTTNNKVELTAILQALRQTDNCSLILVRTDSQYALNTCKTWCWKWAKKGWGKKKNLDIIQCIMQEITIRNVHWEWVRGHNGDPDNERCDVLAEQAATNFKKP